MSFVKVTKDLIENVTLTARPKIRFISSSAGPTGSVDLAARPSKTLKELVDPAVFVDSTYSSERRKVNKFLRRARYRVKSGETNVTGALEKYMEIVHSQSAPIRHSKSFPITRFEPPFTYQMNTTIKNITKNILMPFYRPSYDNCEFSYKNYHCLNFFTASSVPSNSVLLYPNFTSSFGVAPYTLEGEFTFDFYINPRYTNDRKGSAFHAGTILHLSSCYAISLVTGSSIDFQGKVDGYRLMLQLSHSADIAPSSIALTSSKNFVHDRYYPKDLIFLTGDNTLKRNHWHHICIRWGTKDYNAGTGSIMIDTVEHEFCVPSASIDPTTALSSTTNPAEVLCVGNYFTGINTASAAPQKAFFNSNIASIEGLKPAAGFTVDPHNFSFTHPLNAEIHNIRIYEKYLPLDHVLTGAKIGLSDLSRHKLRFYVPPFFVRETRRREVPLTPFQTTTDFTDDPFNVAYAFGVGGHLLNLENFTRDFAQGSYPRLYGLTSSTIDTTVTDGLLANTYLYATASVRKRNLTVLPCDNGLFVPNHTVLVSGSTDKIGITSPMRPFRNGLGNLDLSLIDISDLIPTGSLFEGLIQESGSIMDDIVGSSPSNPGVSAGSVLTIFQRTRDGSSNNVTFFDISNLYYGDKISPGTFSIYDENVTGSDGKVKITLKDNKRGALYRADSITPNDETNFIGNIFYDEGIVLVKTPNIPFFGQDKFEINMRGERNVHILTINVPARADMVNSSSNPTYIPNLTASADPNDNSEGFVYITGINLHDENLNVVIRASLAQPLVKRFEDEFLFKIKLDY